MILSKNVASETDVAVTTEPSFDVVQLSSEAMCENNVVVVHGTLDSCRSFKRVAEHLDEWSVCGYDRRGWAGSRNLGNSGTVLSTHIDDLLSVLETMPPSIVVGHSYGALTAIGAGSRRPTLVRGILAFEPPVRWLPWWPTDDPWEESLREAATAGAAQAAEAMLRCVLGEAYRAQVARRDPADLYKDGSATIVEMLDPTLDEPFFDPLEFQVPIVVAAGTSSMAHHIEVSMRLASLLRSGLFAPISGASHLAHVSHSADFSGLIRKVADWCEQTAERERRDEVTEIQETLA